MPEPRLRLAVGFVMALTLAWPAAAADEAAAKPSPVLAVMKAELERSMATLGQEPVPPYFTSYTITETRTATVSASFGALLQSGEFARRQLDVDLRVGDYELDNTHPLRGDSRFTFRRPSFVEVPLEDDAAAIAGVLWHSTDRAYRQAVEDLTKVRTNVKVKVEAEDQSQDFSRESPQKLIEQLVELEVDLTDWEGRVRRASAPFAAQHQIHRARADLQATAVTRWIVTSEGASAQTSDLNYRLAISAMAKADDGMELPRYESFDAFTPEGLPDESTVSATVERMIADLLALREAPVVEPYTGPAILTGRAAGVFFHEVFGHRIEGHRQKREEEGQTFKKKVDELILPRGFTIYFDPTLRRAAGHDLAGHYRIDDEGVRARRVAVIQDGVFKSFLMSRTPIEGFPKSNGHGRRQPGFDPVARQSNLIVEVDDAVRTDDLERRLLELLREEGKPFGLIFEDIQGGFTLTGRRIPNAFNVLPILVQRIFPDGRRELVRGVDLIGTPLAAFSSILAADGRLDVFNGTCGAESGGVPVSAVSPGILLRQIEVQKKEKSQDRPPVLPAPRLPDVAAGAATSAR